MKSCIGTSVILLPIQARYSHIHSQTLLYRFNYFVCIFTSRWIVVIQFIIVYRFVHKLLWNWRTLLYVESWILLPYFTLKEPSSKCVIERHWYNTEDKFHCWWFNQLKKIFTKTNQKRFVSNSADFILKMYKQINKK